MLELLFGYVSNIDINARVCVKLPQLGERYTTDFMPVLRTKSKNDKEGVFLDMDEEVAVIYDIEKEDGLVLGAINTDVSMLSIFDRNKQYYTYADGTHFEYDKAQHKATANIAGTTEITTQKTIHNGDLYVNGSIHCSKDVQDKTGTMQQIREIHNDHDHPNGNNGSPTGKPTTQM